MKQEKEPKFWFGLSRLVIVLFLLGVVLPFFCSTFFNLFPLQLTFVLLFFFGLAMLLYDIQTRDMIASLTSGEKVDFLTLLLLLLGAILFSFGLAGFFLSILLSLFPYN